MRIGVWNTAFLGDAVLTLPLLRALSQSSPGARVDFWVRAGLEPLFQAQPELAAVYGVAKRGKAQGLGGFLATARAVRSQGYDLWISAHRSLRSGLVAAFSGAGRRVGYDSPLGRRFFYTSTVPRGFGEEPEIERLLRLAPQNAPALTPAPKLDPWPELALSPAAQAAAAAFWDARIASPVLAVHPGSTWPTKRWPSAGFSRVASCAAAAGAQVLLFGGPGEVALVEEVLAGIDPAARPRVVNLTGALDLPTLAAYLARCDCYLGNDAGPLHLAWAQRVPVVALFGPTVREHGFFPRGPRAIVLEKELVCRPCGLHGKRRCPEGHHHCMTRIAPEEVWQASRVRLGV